MLEAAASKQLSGASQEALSLLSRAAAGPLEPLDHARLKFLHGQIEVDLSRGAAALPLLLDAARQLEPLDASLSRDAYLAALRAASVAGRLGPGMTEVARAALQAPPAPDASRAVDWLVDGLAVRCTDGYTAGVPALKRALTALRAEAELNGVSVRWPWFARRVAAELFTDDTWHYLAARSVREEAPARAYTDLIDDVGRFLDLDMRSQLASRGRRVPDLRADLASPAPASGSSAVPVGRVDGKGENARPPRDPACVPASKWPVTNSEPSRAAPGSSRRRRRA